MNEADRKIFEEVVGPIEGSIMTPKQHYQWSRHMVQDAGEDYNAQCEALGIDPTRSMVPSALHRTFLPYLPDSETSDETYNNTAAILARIAYTTRFQLSDEETAKFMAFVKTNKLEALAGAKLSEHKFPTTNCLFELTFAAGNYPVIVPRGDGVDTSQVRVKRMAIHCVYDQKVESFTHCSEPEKEIEFLRWAQILAFIEDAMGNVYIYAGIVQYGAGGALIYPVWAPEELAAAYAGQNPRDVVGEPMSHLSRFICGVLAHLVSYHQEVGGEVPGLEGITVGDFEIKTEQDNV